MRLSLNALSLILSLKQLHLHLFAILRMAKSNKGLTIEFSYYGQVYRMEIVPTGVEYRRTHKQRKLRPLRLRQETCPECSSPMVGGVCLGRCKLAAPRKLKKRGRKRKWAVYAGTLNYIKDGNGKKIPVGLRPDLE
jgi:hypothetical protein